MTPEKTLILIPTYNEQGNVEKLFNEITALGLNLDFLFIDDNSPDGTGKTINGLAEKHSGVNVIHRAGKQGIGSAHLDGIWWAYEHHYKTVITMDCDFTHSPEYIPDFISNADSYDVVVGSRYIGVKSLKEWDLLRRALTSMAHFLTIILLKMKYDATGGYRLYRLDKIPQGIFKLIKNKDYSFFFESLYVLYINKFTVQEIPIYLPIRLHATSKMTLKQAMNWGIKLFSLYRDTIFNKKRFNIS